MKIQMALAVVVAVFALGAFAYLALYLGSASVAHEIAIAMAFVGPIMAVTGLLAAVLFFTVRNLRSGKPPRRGGLVSLRICVTCGAVVTTIAVLAIVADWAGSMAPKLLGILLLAVAGGLAFLAVDGVSWSRGSGEQGVGRADQRT